MYSVEEVKNVLLKAEQAVVQKKGELCELDGKSGDGDLGLSMEAAFIAMHKTMEDYTGSDIGQMLMQSAMSCNAAAPSTMGTLISAGIMALAKLYKGRKTLEAAEVAVAPRAFAEGIMHRGNAKLGDKTILDALCPMADSVEQEFTKNGNLKSAFTVAASVAEKAAQATAGMHAAIGRAKWLGERAAQYPDAGAVLCEIIAKGLIAN